MVAHRGGLRWMIALIAVLTVTAGASRAAPLVETFWAELDEDSQVVDGGGTGFGQGQWFEYEHSNWWNQWFENAPFDPNRKKELEVEFTVRLRDPAKPGWMVVAFNWTTPAWTALDHPHPPLPQNVPDAGIEAKYIERHSVVSLGCSGNCPPLPPERYRFTVPDYCPEWVSIDVRGTNVVIEGTFEHECVPKGPVPECAPTHDGRGCMPVDCPYAGDECLPSKIRIDTSGAEPVLTVLECECISPNLCHVALILDAALGVDCVGGCPQAKECVLTATENPDGTVDYECECVTGPQLEACCLPDGTCANLTAEDCQAEGGTPQGEGTQCTAPRACCLPDGSCVAVDPLCCDEMGGVPSPIGAGQCLGDNNGDGVDDACGPREPRDFGDAPEGAIAYPWLCVQGNFPTCANVGPAGWIEHNNFGAYFGPKFDFEPEGNGGKCPVFAPDNYNQDECMNDGDAGLIRTTGYTIRGLPGEETPHPCWSVLHYSLGRTCHICIWGTLLDIEVHNHMPNDATAYVNLLIDWNQDGQWGGTMVCPQGPAPEHALVNFPVPNGFDGRLSELNPPNFQIGPYPGYLWSRFTISERPVEPDWTGEGIFDDGETEDYLLWVERRKSFECDWQAGDPHKMHWPQLPDLDTTGLDVDMAWTHLADNFLCTDTNAVTDIHFWASFANDCMPTQGLDGLAFQVTIYANLEPDGLIHRNRPGDPLWTRYFPPIDYTVQEVAADAPEGWYDPTTGEYVPENHRRVFQYNLCVDHEPFVQQEGELYWIEIKHVPPENANYSFGWKTTERLLRFEEDAVWRHPELGWVPLKYPQGHPYQERSMDLSFVITGGPADSNGGQFDLDFGDAPDPKYPTLSGSNGARHRIVEGIYLGNGVDADADGQPNATATGDDGDGNDDEDGVVFTSLLSCGSIATVTVTASTSGCLNAWLDFNKDGDWSDPGEQVFTNEPLGPGANNLVVHVPAGTTAGTTFARFRFSTAAGLSYDGPAPDGEVEDYTVVVVIPVAPKAPPKHLKWSQPPIERDLPSQTPVYCGWDEPSFRGNWLVSSPTQWKIVADDFRCLGTMPITSVHWWGSYKGWDGVEPPDKRPVAWRIGFWSNVGPDSPSGGNFSRPGKLLWQVDVSADRVHEELAGADRFPDEPHDACYQYFVKLLPDEYFRQDNFVRFGEPGTDSDVFWISITALYEGHEWPACVWGWKSRPRHWMDAAVSMNFRRDHLVPGFVVEPADVEPIANSLVCERLDLYDMAFELDTDPDYIKWEQPFTGIRHWPHYEDEESLAVMGPEGHVKWVQQPDLSYLGVDVDATRDLPPTWPPQVLADDFKCTTTGKVTAIEVWGSWYEDILPSQNAENVVFTLSIRADVPADSSPESYSKPGEVLWRQEFGPETFTVEAAEAGTEAFYCPCNGAYEPHNHHMVYKYRFNIPPNEAFLQTGSAESPRVYWLSVQARVVHPPGSDATRFGWKTSKDHWNDDAVWVQAKEPDDGPWNELRYPPEHPYHGQSIDLAFAIETETGGNELRYRRLVADDWRCKQRTPITSVVWWGSYIGYQYAACECDNPAPPTKPDYFLLSIWSDVPDPNPNDANTFSHPGEKIWEYRADSFDEVTVGFDKHPEVSIPESVAREPVFRYSVRLPQERWFCQGTVDAVYWLSVVAVYEDPHAVEYPWGWTNHKCTSWEPPGLVEVAHWRLDEVGGTIAKDSSGNGNDGVLVGDPTWRPCCGRVCGALDLDGQGDYVKVDAPSVLAFAPNSFAVSAWARPRQVVGEWRTIVEYERDGNDRNRFGLWVNRTGNFHFRVGWNIVDGTQVINSDEWHLVTGSYDADNDRMNLYVDGLLENWAVRSRGFESSSVDKLTIGVRGWEDSEFFDGLIDDVRVYNRHLRADEALALLDTGLNDDAVAGHLDVTGWNWEPLHDQVGASEDMSFMLFTEPGCYPCCQEHYFEWLAVGKPDCWCNPRQCHGDADGQAAGGAKAGFYYVGPADLNLLVGAWLVTEPPFGPGIASVPNGICADFAHDQGGGDKAGYYRVGPTDLNILVSNWLTREPPKGPGIPPDCLECP